MCVCFTCMVLNQNSAYYMVKVNNPTKEHRCIGKPIPLPEHHREGCVHLNRPGTIFFDRYQPWTYYQFVDLLGVNWPYFPSLRWARKPLNTSRKWRASRWGTSPKPWWGEFLLTAYNRSTGVQKFQKTKKPNDHDHPPHVTPFIPDSYLYQWWFLYIYHPMNKTTKIDNQKSQLNRS